MQHGSWYAKAEFTFSDAIAAVRRQLWTAQHFQTSPHSRDMTTIPRALLSALTDVACCPA